MPHFAGHLLDDEAEGLARLHAILHGDAPAASAGRSVTARRGRAAAKAARPPLPMPAERFGPAARPGAAEAGIARPGGQPGAQPGAQAARGSLR